MTRLTHMTTLLAAASLLAAPACTKRSNGAGGGDATTDGSTDGSEASKVGRVGTATLGSDETSTSILHSAIGSPRGWRSCTERTPPARVAQGSGAVAISCGLRTESILS